MNKKSGFLTFCLAFIPGAAHMYHGYMKRGISIMAAAALLITMISTYGSVLFPMMLVVVWFAAFFDAFHVAAYTPEQRGERPDDWLWNTMNVEWNWNVSHYKALGVACIVLGAWLCLDQLPAFLSELGFNFGGITWTLRRYLPPVVLALALIWLGLRFIVGPRRVDTSATWQPEAPQEAKESFEEKEAAAAVFAEEEQKEAAPHEE